MSKQMRIIATKITPPALREKTICRARLLNKLQMLFKCKVLVVQGGPGSGKTTLLTSFMKENPGLPLIWVTLDSEDNDLFSFWYYVFTVLQPMPGEEHLFQDLIWPLPQKQELQTILIAFLEILHLEKPTVLVLDDFHHIKDDSILRSIEFFMKHSPPNLSFAFLTREAPGLSFSEWMVSGRYLEILPKELQFTIAESALFLSHTLGLKLEKKQIDALFTATEGWAGGLQLMALAAEQGVCGENEKIPILNPYTVHYLSNEILNRLSEREKEFLLMISIFADFDAELCKALTGWEDADLLLDRFSEKNLFLINLDFQQKTLRFHHLFGEFLRDKFSLWNEDKKLKLHLKAAALLQKRNDLKESIRHSLAAKDYLGAMALIGKASPSLIYWGYLKKIPLESLVQNEEMAFQRAFYHYCNMEFDQCSRLLEEMEARSGGTLKSFYRLFLYIMEDKPPGTLEIKNYAAEFTDLDWNAETKSMLYVTFPLLLSMIDRYQDAYKCVKKGEALEKRLNNPYIRYFVLNFKAQIKEALGELNESHLIYDRMFALLDEYPVVKHLRSNAYIGAAGVFLAKMRLEEAQKMLDAAKKRITPGLIHLESAIAFNQMELYVLSGQYEIALDLILELEQSAFGEHFIYLPSLLKYLLILQNQISAFPADLSKQLVEKIQKNPFFGHSSVRISDKLVKARIFLFQGRDLEALALLERIIADAKKEKIKPILVEALLLKGNILNSEAEVDRDLVCDCLNLALINSFENDCQAPYFLERELVAAYLPYLYESRYADSNSPEAIWIGKLKDRLKDVASLAFNTEVTERELEVLEVLKTGRTNQEIADKLFISLATVKSHLINIYSKLGATNRIEAINKALELGLLKDFYRS